LVEANAENAQLKNIARDFGRVQKALGQEQTKSILEQARKQEQAAKREVRSVKRARELA
jgi:sialic acid synthase SpsE